MTLSFMQAEAFAARLAAARHQDAVDRDRDLRRIPSLKDAQGVQDAAVRALGVAQIGYALSATSRATARLLGCDEPVAGPLLAERILEDGASLRLPGGVIGLGAGFCFLLGRSPSPLSRGPVTDAAAADACVICRLELHVLGRRVRNDLPLNEWTDTADFGLDVAHVLGPRVRDWRTLDLGSVPVTVAIDGHPVARGRGSDTLGNPVAGVAWLARGLAERERFLNVGDLVTTGSCTGLVQVLPGQGVRAEFGTLGTVSLDLR